MIFAFGLLVGLLVNCAYADPNSGVGLSKISLPSGPGSIEGLGDSFEPQLNSGTSAYSVKIAVPPGVNGLQPEVVLRYNAGSGNGPFGLEWSYGPMFIQRETQKGLPTYGASDGFILEGEELVPLADGSYRMKNESAFMRITRSGDGWAVTEKSGKVHFLGVSSQARVARTFPSTFVSTFKWCEEQVFDTHSNQIQFTYNTYLDSTGQVYCTAINYSMVNGNAQSVVFDFESRTDVFSSFLSGFEVKTGRRCDQISVLSNGGLVRRYQLSYVVPTNDPIEAVSPTDAGLSFSLLHSVTQFDNRNANIASYLPPLQFGYTRFDAAAGVHGSLTNRPPISLGDANMAIADINCDSLPDFFYTDPLTGHHTVYYNLGNGLFSNGVPFINYPNQTLANGNVELADFDGDGKVDLVLKTGASSGLFGYYPNTTSLTNNDEGHPSWGPLQSFPAPFPPFNLSDPSARTLDLNGDKRMDYMQTTLYGFIYFYNNTNGWQQDGIHLFGDRAMGDIAAADNVQFSVSGSSGTPVANKYVKLADMNGDRLLDLVRLSVAGTQLQVTYWPNKGWGAWGNRQIMSGNIDLGVIPVDDVFVMDINGDGLADIVAVGYNYILYWINQGNGSFSQQFVRTGMPNYQRGVTVLRQADINGNGSTDFIWENYDPVARAYNTQYYDFLGAAKPNLLSVIDNGIGQRTSIAYKTTTDYYAAAWQSGMPWHTRLPFPSTVVSKITKSNGLSLDGVPGGDQYITEFSFYDGFYDGFMKEFRGFGFAKKIDHGDDQFIGTPQQIPVYSPSTITRYRFHTGTPDGIDYTGAGLVDNFDPIAGYIEEPLKGKVLWSEVTLPTADFGGSYPAQVDGQMANDAVVFSRDVNNWRIKLIHTATNGFTYVDAYGNVNPALSLPYSSVNGNRVQFAFLANHTNEILEANGTLAGSDAFTPLRSAKETYVENDYDFYGNMIAERNYGEISQGAYYGDERFTYNTYAFNLNAWLIGLPAIHRITDVNGVFVSESDSYYDGNDFTGLPLGQVGAYGDMMSEISLINGADIVPPFSTISTQTGDPRLAANASVTSVRNRYDTYGNLVETRDPLYQTAGQGHSKQYTYDSVFQTFVTTETIHVGNGSPDLVAQAGYDYGAGVMTVSTNFNGNSTSYLYDSFWRLVGIVKPGDSTAFPTATFAYTPGDSFRQIYYDYDSAGNLTLVNSADPSVVNSVATHQRTQAGMPNTFDTTSFTDGMGQKLGTLEENDVAGQWVAKDFKLYSSKGAERRSFLPFLVSSATYQTPPETSANVASFYDSAGRVTTTVNPPETSVPGATQTQTRTVYLPLETVLYDEEQTLPTSSRYLNCHHQFKDGLDRLVGVSEVIRLNDDGTISGSRATWLTSYEYDLNDNLTHITDSQGNQKWFRYDGLKRKLFMNDPDRGTMTYAYDDASNLRSTLDAKSQTISYNYDGVNRLLAEFYRPTNQPPDVTYHYDIPEGVIDLGDGTKATPQNTLGMLAYVQDLSGEEHTSYDARGRVNFVVKRIPDPLFLSTTNLQLSTPLVSYRTGFAYDSLDRVNTLTYPDDDFVNYGYNSRNLLNQIAGGPSGFVISNILYQPSAQLQEIDYGNNVRTTYGYDPRLRLNSLITAPATNPASPLISFSYDFDGVSNIKDILDNRPASAVASGDPRRNTQLFTYDDLYRITQSQYSFNTPGDALRNDGQINYLYDRIGNMLAQNSSLSDTDQLTGLPVANLGTMNSGGSGGTGNRIGRAPSDPPGPHALSQIVSTNAPARNYAYDANGNMTVIDGLTNTWDFKDRLVAVENASMRAQYAYDYTDRRITKQVFTKAKGVASASPTLTTLYIDKYFEVRENDAPTKYVWNGNIRVARVTGSLNSSQRVQRVRLWPGYNLISIAVNGAKVPAGPGLTAYLWNAGTLNWQTVSIGTMLAAASVLWVQDATNGVLTLTGNYSEPTNSPVSSGPNFLPVPGLEGLTLTNANAQLATNEWHYDAQNQLWQIALVVPLTNFNSLPPTLAPGEVLFVRADATTQLTPNDPTLRLMYYHQDHLGSSGVVTDSTGHLSEEKTYYPFGQSREDFQPRGIEEDYNFIQKEQDQETQLHYFSARYLASSNSRFLSWDPSSYAINGKSETDPQALNTYAYARGEPLKLIDPSGQIGVIAAALVVGVAFWSYEVYHELKTELPKEAEESAKLGPFAENGKGDSISSAPSPVEAVLPPYGKAGEGPLVDAAKPAAQEIKSVLVSIGNQLGVKSAAFTAANKAAPAAEAALKNTIVNKVADEAAKGQVQKQAEGGADRHSEGSPDLPKQPSPGPAPEPNGPPPATPESPGASDIDANRS